MNIEETTENLKKYISFSEKECNFPSIWDWNWHMDLANDIKTLLTAYEKEKETSHYIQSQLDIANAKLVEEKEKNKELEKMLNLKSHKRRYNTMNYIKKNKLNKFDSVGICQDMRAFKRTGEIKYRAYITFQNKQYTLGTYTSLDKAKEARKKGEIMVENIKKNFIEKIKGEE